MKTEPQPHQQNSFSPIRRRIKSQTLSRNEFKGITLKQYFRLVDESHDRSILQQVKEEDVDSSRNSLTETPAFGQPKRNLCKLKVKTEATEDELQNYNKSINLNFEQTIKLLTHKKNTDSIDKLNTFLARKISCSKKPQKKRTQKIKTLSLQQIDLSTMNGFYKHKKNMNENTQIEKRQKMLQKIQADKDRTIDLKQQDIFYITKHANKFNIDPKKLLQ